VRRPTRRAAIGGALALATPSAASATARPRRIVSLSPCLDTLLVNLVPEARIAALSRWSRETGGSTITEVARRLPTTYGTAEEILLLKPDLVISSIPTPLTIRQSLPRLGIPLTLFQVPATVEESLRQVHEVAARVGEADRGADLVRRIRLALDAAAPPPGAPRLSALIFQRDGFASGPGTLMDEMLTRTGFTNQTRRYGMTASGNVPLEQLAADPPDVLLVGESAPGSPSWGERLLRHPALVRARRRSRPVVFPAALVYCGGPVLIKTARTLSGARLALLGARA
jgi:iron complex transport system substrate-binding protein